MKMQSTGPLISYVGFLTHVPPQSQYSQKIDELIYLSCSYVGFSDATTIQTKKKVHMSLACDSGMGCMSRYFFNMIIS
jgi:hypothetical protein